MNNIFSKKLILLLIILVGFLIIILFFKNQINTQKNFYSKTIEGVAMESYNGIITNKFYDKYNHGTNKLVVTNGISKKEIDFMFEEPNLYEFIRIGDSISKEKNTLEITIFRENIDTIIKLNFGNLKKR